MSGILRLLCFELANLRAVLNIYKQYLAQLVLEKEIVFKLKRRPAMKSQV